MPAHSLRSRLVEQEDVGLNERDTGEVEPPGLAAGKPSERRSGSILEAVEQRRAAMPADPPLSIS